MLCNDDVDDDDNIWIRSTTLSNSILLLYAKCSSIETKQENKNKENESSGQN